MQEMNKKNEFLSILLIAAMFAVAGISGQKEIIFPEIAALALGAWVLETPPWHGTNFNFWLSPSLAALTGVTIVRYFPYSPVLMTAGAFVVVILQLKLLRSAILPSISAAILPVITHAGSWYYPLSVCILAGIIAFGRVLMNRSLPAINDDGLPSLPGRFMAGWDRNAVELKHWGKILAGILAVSVAAVEFHVLYMLAPPLIVAFVELSKPDGILRRKSAKILLLLVLAAFSGVCWLYLFESVLHRPIWISACISTISVFLVYRAMRLPFPPAVAIALLPTIIPAGYLWSYPLHVLFGSAAFVLISILWFGKNRLAEGNSEETAVTEAAIPG